MLFNIYINDMYFTLNETDICNFANDTTRPGRKFGNLGKFFPTFSLPTFRFWPNTQDRKLGRRNLGKKIPRFPTFPSFRFTTFRFNF